MTTATTTAKDLFIIAMDPAHAVGQGDLSLALAGAELIDLLDSGTVEVRNDRVLPAGRPEPADRLLRDAAAAVVRQTPYERVEDWLWRRGSELSAAYQSALEEDGELTQRRDGRLPFGPDRVGTVDTTPAHHRAAERWREEEPVLVALASALGIGEQTDAEAVGEEPVDGGPEGEEPDGGGPGRWELPEEERAAAEAAAAEPVATEPGFENEAVTTVVAAVHDAVMELESVRQRRAIESSAFANLWRGV
ncbi:GPP34 family phosphoprotein [Streptomyces sp. XM4193]|uniref:GOLPH3/VPS74 family protein n=1 Tax=Streptomyces sp. XM4193 TaxID=2929782 RepID=UPI001FF9BE67|nr:GPP34 family phosphoprotein [Streptomyces sp. XM4193]MCK1797019.1 GPP34 family phosphoprotein [Streptomyces sp. XM4193]